MINHISIGVNDPEKVANFLAKVWNGYTFPFPPSPNSYIVLADDGKGTAVEVTPVNTVLVPGEGFPAEAGFDKNTLTEEFEAKFVSGEYFPEYVATHLALNTHLSEAEIMEMAKHEGWRTLICNRGEGQFQLIEVWVENRFLLEVFTPEMTERYVEILQPQFMADAMQISLPPKPSYPPANLNTIA